MIADLYKVGNIITYTIYYLIRIFKWPSGHFFDMPLEEDDIQFTDGYFKFISYNWNVDGAFTKHNS